MGFNFPAPATENQEFTPAGGVTYIYKAPRWMVKGVPGFDQATADPRYVNVTGDTMTGDLTITKGNAGVVLDNSADTGNVGTLWWQRATKTRWVQWVNGGETGSGNTGSDLWIARYNDAGAYLGAAFDIKRSTGVVNFAVAPTVAGAALASPPGGSTTQVQFNDAGVFGGDAGLVFDKTTDKLTIGGSLTLPSSGTPSATKFNFGGADTGINGSSAYVAIVAGGGNRVTVQAASITTTVPFGLVAATTGNTSLNMPHGTAPTSPTNGDLWTTTAGLYARINGATVGPYSAGGTPGGSTTQVQFNDAGVFGGDAGMVYDKTTDKLTTGLFSAGAGTVGAPSYTFTTGSTTGLRYASASLFTVIGGNDRMSVSGNGITALDIPVIVNHTTAVAQLHLKSPATDVGVTKWNEISGFVGGKLRWGIYPGSGTHETGGNVGSDFLIDRYADDGTTYLGWVLVINRATGSATFNYPVAVATPTAPTHAATKAYVDTKMASVYVGDSPPSSIVDGMLWWRSTDGVMFIRFNDGSSSQWVEA